MSIASEITRINTNIANSYTKVNVKGGTLPVTQNSVNLANAIDSIEVIEQQTAEGEGLSLANTKAMPYKDYVVKGKSEQEVRSGNNLFKIISNQTVADVALIYNQDGSYTLNGLANGNSNFVLSGQTLNAGNYTLQCKYEGTLPTNEVPRLQIYIPSIQLDVRINTTDSNTVVQNFTLSNTVTDVNFRIRVLSGFNYDNLKLYPMLVSGTYTSQTIPDFEPYGDKPSSSNPSEIYSVADEGTVTIKQRGTTESNDFIFQTSPLRSLPNEIKDTIEVDGLHRKIGIQTGTLTQTTTITLSDAKSNGAYMCNIKSSGTLTGQTIELGAGNYEIIYELETEVIEPLTQNQATTMLDITHTGSYENTTNIYTDEDVKPTIEVDYYKKG